MSGYSDTCSVCGYNGEFKKNNPSFREGYQCPKCKSSLRYRGQAQSILNIYGNYNNLIELFKDPKFSILSIYEPGLAGPFRRIFSKFNNYQNSFYWDDVNLGEFKDGIQCQSLEALTFEDSQIDLIISSDIMEHVRHPWEAFKDIYRVLKPGGYHVFSIPLHLPMPSKSKFRVDTSTDKDVYIEEPLYHGDGVGGKSLVYIDYGADISDFLTNIGYKVTLEAVDHTHYEAKKLVTFITQKPNDTNE